MNFESSWTRPLGVVVTGSLGEGVKVRLNSDVTVEEVRLGANVVIQGQYNLSLIHI